MSSLARVTQASTNLSSYPIMYMCIYIVHCTLYMEPSCKKLRNKPKVLLVISLHLVLVQTLWRFIGQVKFWNYGEKFAV